MHRTALRLIPLLCVGALACGLTTITLDEESVAVVEGGTVLETLAGELGLGEFFTASIVDSQELANQGVTAEQIDTVYVTALTLTVTDPAGQDLTFLDEVTFFISADGLETQAIAWGGPFPEGVTEVSLELADVDLAPYAVKESMVIDTDVTGRRPAQDTTVKAAIELEVKVNPRGVACGGAD